MCKPASEGGQRCAAHTRKALAKAEAAAQAALLDYREATAEDQPLTRLQSLGQAHAATTEALFRAHVEHASTPTGKREYEAALAKAQAEGDEFAATQASGVLQRGAELRERNKGVADALKAAAAQKATQAPKATSSDHAVCNACGWEGDEAEAPGGHCPKCKQDQVNYFHKPTQAAGEPQPTRPDGKMVTGDDLAGGGCFIDPGSGDVVEIHKSYPWNGGWQFDTTDGWSVVVEKGQKVEQVPDGTETTGDTFEDFKADQHAANHPNAMSEDDFERDYAPVGDGENPMTDDPPTGVSAHHVWSIVEGEQDYQYAVPGIHHVNTVGFIQTEKPWVTGAEEAIWVDGSEFTD